LQLQREVPFSQLNLVRQDVRISGETIGGWPILHWRPLLIGCHLPRQLKPEWNLSGQSSSLKKYLRFIISE
jgi:hypothetical protein